MLPQLSPHNSLHHVNQAFRRPPYTIVTYGQYNYRILSKQFQGGISMLNTWAAFWSVVLLLTMTITFLDLLSINMMFSLICGSISSILFTIAVFINRKELKKIVLFSSINFSLFIIIETFISFLYMPWMLIPSTLYILVQFIASCFLMKSKGHIFGKVIFLIQILIISLKVDEKIKVSWRQILFGFVILMFLTFICLIFVGIYLLYAACKRKQQVQYEYKFQGILFLFISLFSIMISLFLPIVQVFLGKEIWKFSLSFSFIYILIPIYIYLKKKEIVIIFCTLNEVKSFNQFIQIQKIQDNQDLQNTQATSKVQRSKSYCYRISSNWFSFQPQPPALQNKQQNIQNPQMINQIPQCLICLQEKAELIWMPCGHLIVCIRCCQFMFQKKNINCVLCKKIPEQLFLINVKTIKQQQNEKKKNQNQESKQQNKNEVSSELLIQKQAKKAIIEQAKNESMKQIIQMQIQIEFKNQQNQKNVKMKQELNFVNQENAKNITFVNKDAQKKSIRRNNIFQILQGFNVKVI